MHDSGQRQSFDTGAVRDTAEGKVRPDLISPWADFREGDWLAKGAEKYDERNWEKGIPISRCIASLERHLVAYKLGLTDEDHMAAIRTNAGFILHFEEEINAGRLPGSLDDMPKYAQRGLPGYVKAIASPEGCKEGEMVWTHKAEYGDSVPTSICGPTCPVCGSLSSVSVGRIRCCRRCSWSSIFCDAYVDELRQAYLRRPAAYIAGPMRGYPNCNFPAFDKAAEQLYRKGYRPINPADLDRMAYGLGHGAMLHIPEEDIDIEACIRRDIEALLELDPKRDILVLLDGWRASRGAQAEYHLAEWRGLYSVLGGTANVPDANGDNQ
jgi:hypothetical protein